MPNFAVSKDKSFIDLLKRKTLGKAQNDKDNVY